ERLPYARVPGRPVDLSAGAAAVLRADPRHAREGGDVTGTAALAIGATKIAPPGSRRRGRWAASRLNPGGVPEASRNLYGVGENYPVRWAFGKGNRWARPRGDQGEVGRAVGAMPHR